MANTHLLEERAKLRVKTHFQTETAERSSARDLAISSKWETAHELHPDFFRQDSCHPKHLVQLFADGPGATPACR